MREGAARSGPFSFCPRAAGLGAGCDTLAISRSEEISRAFYAQLGAHGLASRTRPEWDDQIVRALLEMLPPHGRVLDIGCGYGRIAVPLARAGYDVEGLDLSSELVEAARRAAAAGGVDVAFTVGSMTRLPHPADAFDVIVCLWSAFHELLEEDEQTRALAEMWRVLRPAGFALIEGPRYEEGTEAEMENGPRRGRGGRIKWELFDGAVNAHYAHDEGSLRRVCERAGIAAPHVFERDWAGRRRLFLRFEKPRA